MQVYGPDPKISHQEASTIFMENIGMRLFINDFNVTGEGFNDFVMTVFSMDHKKRVIGGGEQLSETCQNFRDVIYK